MSNKEEKEYVESVNTLILELNFKFNNPPQSMKVKDPKALNQANDSINQARQKMNSFKSGGMLIGAGTGAIAGAYAGLSFGPFGALAGAIIGAIAGGAIGAGIGEFLLGLLELISNAKLTWERAYGITRTLSSN